MVSNASARRRWLGVIVLGAAILMLVAGQTVLQGKMTGALYITYWMLCLIFTSAAIVVAFTDVRATSVEIRKQERELIEDTIRQIQSDANQQPQARHGRN